MVRQEENADELVCGICLLTFDGSASPVQTTHGERLRLQEALWCKLEAIGFLQVCRGSRVPFPLCSWCSARVEDAYELKQLCMKAACGGQDEANLIPVKDYATSEPAIDFETDAPLNLTWKDGMPGLIKIAPRRSSLAGMTISVVLAAAHDMFTCIRNLSGCLRLNSFLLENAVHFTENTLSLLTVLSTLKEETAAVKKSAETVRKEAEMWKIKSAMMDDATSFVKNVSCTDLRWSKPVKGAEQFSAASQESRMGFPLDGTRVVPVNSSETPARHVSPMEFEESADFSSIEYFPLPNSDVNNNLGSDKVENNMDSSPPESQSVRRSFRSRSVVDHLVYWPSFKKPIPTGNRPPAAKIKPSTLSSAEVLDSLLLRRGVVSDTENASNEKWSIVKKRKISNAVKSVKKQSVKNETCSKTHVLNPQTDTTALENENKSLPPEVKEEIDEGEEAHNCEEGNCDSNENHEDENNQEVEVLGPLLERQRNMCHICGKVLSCGRNLKAHIKMHIGSSPYQCNYCHKVFSSSWNRAQHERVHTGEKPYVCNVCQMSFRYNVSLRHHKLKSHAAV